jgi:hypothetical protein
VETAGEEVLISLRLSIILFYAVSAIIAFIYSFIRIASAFAWKLFLMIRIFPSH